MANPPPAPAQKKRGLGCCGCGCALLVILALLFLGLIGGVGYLSYRGALKFTSPTPAVLQTFDGGDDVYNGAQQKITAFNQALQQDQPASLQLSADEINTLIARNPDLARLKIHIFVSITDDQATVQVSYPCSLLPLSFLKDRYLNGDTTFGLDFDSDDRTVHITLHSFKLGSTPVPDANIPLVESELNPIINADLQRDPTLKKIIARAKTIEIKNGVFDVETQ